MIRELFLITAGGFLPQFAEAVFVRAGTRYSRFTGVLTNVYDAGFQDPGSFREASELDLRAAPGS